jgi:hypothetical protein
MKINFDQPFKTLSGEVIRDPKSDEILTLKWACTEALCQHYPKEEIDGKEKMARFKLAFNIEKGGEQDISVEDTAKLKDLVGKWGVTLIVGQAFPMLDPTEK